MTDMKMPKPNVGKRRRINIEGENYYLIVTNGDDGPSVDITCPRENSPENIRMRTISETITTNVNEMLSEIFIRPA